MVYSYELRNNGFLNDISDFYEKFSPSFIAWNLESKMCIPYWLVNMKLLVS